MRYWRFRAVLIVLVVAVAFSIARPISAWWPIAHYEISRQSLGPEIAKYSQLPDYADSWLYLQGLELFDINQYFCWGHGAIDMGDCVDLEIAPAAPMYPDDGRYPGPVMWKLIQKLRSGTAEMEKAARGMVAHNAADRAVHFNFFLGPELYHLTPHAAWIWLQHHRRKERWADYWVFIKNYYDGDPDAAFEAGGGLKVSGTPLASGLPLCTANNDIAKIMRLGQLVYRRNGRRFDFTDLLQGLSVQSTQEIKDSLSSTMIEPYNSAAKLQSIYTRSDFESRDDDFFDTDFTSLNAKYNQAVTNVTQWSSQFD